MPGFTSPKILKYSFFFQFMYPSISRLLISTLCKHTQLTYNLLVVQKDFNCCIVTEVIIYCYELYTICKKLNISPLSFILSAEVCNSYIPPWGWSFYNLVSGVGMVVLHIGVGRTLTPMCKTTPHLGNITVEERCEQHFYVLPR